MTVRAEHGLARDHAPDQRPGARVNERQHDRDEAVADGLGQDGRRHQGPEAQAPVQQVFGHQPRPREDHGQGQDPKDRGGLRFADQAAKPWCENPQGGGERHGHGHREGQGGRDVALREIVALHQRRPEPAAAGRFGQRNEDQREGEQPEIPGGKQARQCHHDRERQQRLPARGQERPLEPGQRLQGEAGSSGPRPAVRTRRILRQAAHRAALPRPGHRHGNGARRTAAAIQPARKPVPQARWMVRATPGTSHASMRRRRSPMMAAAPSTAVT